MKKILFALLFVLVAIVAVAQDSISAGGDSNPRQTVMEVTADGHVLTVSADSSFLNLPAAVREAAKEADAAKVVSVDDGNGYVVYNGRAYEIADVAENAFFKRADNGPRYDAMTRIVTLAVGFIVPCVTIIVALIVFLVFWLKKNNARNSIISKAIDCNYELPEAFYTGQTTSDFVETAENTSATGSPLKFTPIPEGARDPKMYTSAISLIAVGLALLVFFSVNANVGVGFLCGGVPLFMGIGRMIAYLYVPGARKVRKQQYNQQPPMYPPADTYYHNQQQPQQRPSQDGSFAPRNFDGPCPPPPPSVQDGNEQMH